jgi:hypothetical protein
MIRNQHCYMGEGKGEKGGGQEGDYMRQGPLLDPGAIELTRETSSSIENTMMSK